MSAVVKAVESAFKVVEKAGKVVVKAVEAVGKVVQGVVDVAKQVVDVVKDIARPALENFAIQKALLLIPGINVYAAAAIAAGVGTLVRGGTVSDALKAGATSALMGNVEKSVFNSAVKAGYSTAQAAAAASAASSAIATGAYGGSPEDILKAAAIGGASGAAGTKVLQETNNLALARFTQTATTAALQGQKIEQVVLLGATSATVSYMNQIYQAQQDAAKVVQERDANYSRYQKGVDEYNRLADQYNNSTSQAQADSLKAQLDRKLTEINALANVISAQNAQIAEFNGVINEAAKKAADEVAKGESEYSDQIGEIISQEEQDIINQIQEVAQRGFGESDQIQLAQYDTGTMTDAGGLDPTQPRFNEILVDERQTPDAIIRTVEGVNQAGERYSYDIVIDRETNDVFYQTGSGNLSGDLSQDLGVNVTAFLERPTFEVTGAAGGSQVFQDIVGNLSNRFGELSQQVNQSTATAQDLLVQQQFYLQQLPQIQAEKQRLAGVKQQAEAVKQQASTPAAVQEADRVIQQITQEQARVDALEKQAQQAAQDAKNAAAQEDARRQAAEAEARRVQQEIEAIRTGRQERTTAAMTERERREREQYERDMAEFERELERLEADLQAARDEAETTRLRQQFVTQQRERLGRAGRLTGQLESQINQEIESLLDEYEGMVSPAAERVEQQRGRRPQMTDTGREITDAEIISLLGLGEEEIGRYGFERGTGTAEGEGEGLGGEGEGTAEGEVTPPAKGEEAVEGGAEGEGAAGTGEPDKPLISRVGIRPVSELAGRLAGRGETPGFGTRVTGEALTGILGEKEPLFGGDDDEQRAVWNRRSLRLRRALGL